MWAGLVPHFILPPRWVGSLVISAYAVCPDITATVTPDLKHPGGKGMASSSLILCIYILSLVLGLGSASCALVPLIPALSYVGFLELAVGDVSVCWEY